MDDREPKHRFFSADLPTAGPATVDLTADEARHAREALRLRTGDDVELFDGCGGLAMAEVVEVSRRSVRVRVDSVQAVQRPGPLVHLGFAVPKGKRLDWLLEKATELGAASLRPVVFERSVAGGGALGQTKRDRWQAHCIAAAKQCGLNYLPEIHEPLSLGEFLAETAGLLMLMGDVSAEARPLAEGLAAESENLDLCLIVGPEGGLTPAERAACIDIGALPVRIGATTLRIETAAVALLAATMALAEHPHTP